jgi:hypothetical protein
LSGVWIGNFTQDREPTMWNMKMTLSQKGEFIDGISVHEPIVNGVIAASVTYDLKGTLSNNVFEFMEGKMLERNASSSWNFCNISGKLNLGNSGKYKVLRGYWECTYQGERFFGKVILRKQ